MMFIIPIYNYCFVVSLLLFFLFIIIALVSKPIAVRYLPFHCVSSELRQDKKQIESFSWHTADTYTRDTRWGQHEHI